MHKRRLGRVMAAVVSVMIPVALMIPDVCASPQPGQPGDFALGALFGAPTGLSMKYWFTETTAVDGALAWHFGDEQRLQIHADHLWHIQVPGWNVPNGRLPVYIGAGLRVIAGDDSEAGVRIPLGLAYLVAKAPIEVFAEIVPV